MEVLMVTAAASYAHEGGWEGLGGGWWWLLRPLMLLLWIVLIAVIVRWVLRSTDRHGPFPMERARDIVAERYARGEINADEFRDRLDRLR
ncbi:MAG TPA: hypothetical protein VGR16_12105 [Thermomicrobiales bacterium]|nr:hypothetical protein [Thermomicrobiales bacterium]